LLEQNRYTFCVTFPQKCFSVEVRHRLGGGDRCRPGTSPEIRLAAGSDLGPADSQAIVQVISAELPGDRVSNDEPTPAGLLEGRVLRMIGFEQAVGGFRVGLAGELAADRGPAGLSGLGVCAHALIESGDFKT
jgi:hypothetical protein